MEPDRSSNIEQPLSAAMIHKLKVSGMVTAVVIACIMGWGFYSRTLAQAALKAQTEQNALTIVTVTKPEAPGDHEDLVLPGNVQAYTEAPIYARTSGYLKHWYVDIGKNVKANELLAELDTPEVDAELRQAKADLATAEANNNLSQMTATRWKTLLASGAVSKQDVDDKVGDAEAKQAEVESARANVSRLEQLESFKRIVAPFDGVITARGTDVGALINSGAANGQELFHIAAINKLRVYVQVPQSYASGIQTGTVAQLHFADHPGKTYTATVVNTARSIDAASRTLLTELSVNNSHHELLPGAYAEVHLAPHLKVSTLEVPGNALLFRSEGMLIATVNANHQVVMKKVQIGRDFGKRVEVLTGIDPDDVIVLNPSDSLLNGAKVRIVQDKG
ncbi:MAG TPA: efflux RND transporter periplasmic adaptor subunit [Steroidobacteraceae bacterium]|nr:efflux RND transporter periplasmic adaptor subunit [Steroidobacteraceae bacterium]